MPEICNMNKNHLLDLYFHEISSRKEREIRKHVEQCSECRHYLETLKQTHHALDQWQDEAPLANTLDLILERIPGPQPEPVFDKPAITIPPIAPFLKIVFSILAVLAIIIFLHDKVTLFPFWETLKECWFVKLLGSLGVTTVLVFLLGAFITLALSPILILESQPKKNRYYFS
ncbi:MAG: hypothetical protein JSV88_07095 [Candidatus Aminicenantes bacterium]|nr:MAG: hypothetical protein JSV88_07095 [Candidatus Aminicenantes bacterium]